jgi:hypothetical protein
MKKSSFQQTFGNKRKENVIEILKMNENLPDFEYYNGDESILKMKLWVQILDILKSKLKMLLAKTAMKSSPFITAFMVVP